MADTADCRNGLLETPKSELTDFVKGKATSVVQSTQNLANLIESRQQSKIFLATNVTKMLDHNTSHVDLYLLHGFDDASTLAPGSEPA